MVQRESSSFEKCFLQFFFFCSDLRSRNTEPSNPFEQQVLLFVREIIEFFGSRCTEGPFLRASNKMIFCFCASGRGGALPEICAEIHRFVHFRVFSSHVHF